MPDSDLALLYQVETKSLKRAVKRNFVTQKLVNNDPGI